MNRVIRKNSSLKVQSVLYFMPMKCQPFFRLGLLNRACMVFSGTTIMAAASVFYINNPSVKSQYLFSLSCALLVRKTIIMLFLYIHNNLKPPIIYCILYRFYSVGIHTIHLTTIITCFLIIWAMNIKLMFVLISWFTKTIALQNYRQLLDTSFCFSY